MKEFVLIVGLGNPGIKYQNTRHNLGKQVIEHYQRQSGSKPFVHKAKLQAEVSTTPTGNLVLATTTTYMNDSGLSLNKIRSYFKITNSNILVVYDDADIEFGKMRLSLGGSSAGHNGVDSIINHIGEDFSRLRIGIGHPRSGELDKYVLKPFSYIQKLKLKDILRHSEKEIDKFAEVSRD